MNGVRTRAVERGEPTRPPRQYALWLLGRREWSEYELRQRLSTKGYAQVQIDDAIDFAQSHGLQSDERFAASRVRYLARARGNRLLVKELSCKGIDADIANRALHDAPDESERAVQAVQRFMGRQLDIKGRARVYRFLVARGFSGDAVRYAMKALEHSNSRGR